MPREDGTSANPCHCACHVYPGVYPTSEARPCSICGHVNEQGWVSGWNGRNGWVRDSEPPNAIDPGDYDDEGGKATGW